MEHLGVVVDSQRMRFEVAPRKMRRVKEMSAALIRQSNVGRRYVPAGRLRSFCGVCVSLSLAMPWARFYTRSLYDALSRGKMDKRGRVKLSHQAM